MAAASAAVDRRPNHAERPIRGLAYRLVERLPEARPAGPALELGGRREVVESAAGAGEDAFPLFLIQRTRERPLGGFLAQDGVLIRAQKRTPLRVGVRDFELFGAL